MEIWSPSFDGDFARFWTLASFLLVLLFFWHAQVLGRFIEILSPSFDVDVTRFKTLASFLFVLLFFWKYTSLRTIHGNLVTLVC